MVLSTFFGIEALFNYFPPLKKSNNKNKQSNRTKQKHNKNDL